MPGKSIEVTVSPFTPTVVHWEEIVGLFQKERSVNLGILQQKGVAWPDIGDFVLWGRDGTMMASMQLLDLTIYRFNSQASTSKVESVCRLARCSGIHL